MAPKPKAQEQLILASNRKALHHYEVGETFECGIVLLGSEIKSLRQGQASMAEAFALVQNGEVWLLQVHIPEYKFSYNLNHDPVRTRKLLLHHREIEKLERHAREKSTTLVPLKIYLVNGRAKVLLAVARGKKHYDKREALKRKEDQREVMRAHKSRGKRS